MKEKIRLKYIEFLAWFVKTVINVFHPQKDRKLFLKYLELRLNLIGIEGFEEWMEKQAIAEASEGLSSEQIDFYGLNQ